MLTASLIKAALKFPHVLHFLPYFLDLKSQGLRNLLQPLTKYWLKNNVYTNAVLLSDGKTRQ